MTKSITELGFNKGWESETVKKEKGKALEDNMCKVQASQMVPVVKNPSANTRDIRDVGSIPGLGRSPEEGHGNPLQYSHLENPMNRGAWQAMVHRVTNQTWQKWLNTHTRTHVQRPQMTDRLGGDCYSYNKG